MVISVKIKNICCHDIHYQFNLSGTKTLPDTNLLFTNDTLYPAPLSSNSTPERVVPSQLNWAAMVPWDPGPSESWNRALEHAISQIVFSIPLNNLIEPTPELALVELMSGNFHIALFDSGTHVPLGSLIIDETPPSTGTAKETFCRAVGLQRDAF